jgi:hypothetical protein
LGYGKDYEITVGCPSCGNSVDQVVDLTELKTQNEPTETSSREFTVILPVSKAEVTLRLLTRGDEIAIEKESKALKKANGDVDSDATARLRAMIKSVNGDSSTATIWSFVENMLVRDARYLREQYKDRIPDVDFNFTVDCECGAEDSQKTLRLPIGASFFWPDARL